MKPCRHPTQTLMRMCDSVEWTVSWLGSNLTRLLCWLSILSRLRFTDFADIHSSTANKRRYVA